MKSSRQDTQKVSFRFGETPFCVWQQTDFALQGRKRAVYDG